MGTQIMAGLGLPSAWDYTLSVLSYKKKKKIDSLKADTQNLLQVIYHYLLNFLFCLLKQNSILIFCSKNEQQ